MKIKKEVDYASLLSHIKMCHGEIFLQTTEGDVLNLKSTLSQYIFISMEQSPELLEDAEITCENVNDYKTLAYYLE